MVCDQRLGGYRTDELEPIAVVLPVGRAMDPSYLGVVVPWLRDGLCPGQLHAVLRLASPVGNRPVYRLGQTTPLPVQAE